MKGLFNRPAKCVPGPARDSWSEAILSPRSLSKNTKN
jgi:hypothetical protein